jgi:hypothetical protein
MAESYAHAYNVLRQLEKASQDLRERATGADPKTAKVLEELAAENEARAAKKREYVRSLPEYEATHDGT